MEPFLAPVPLMEAKWNPKGLVNVGNLVGVGALRFSSSPEQKIPNLKLSVCLIVCVLSDLMQLPSF